MSVVLSKEILEKLYLEEMLSTRGIATKLNVNVSCVRKYLKLYGVPMRNKSWKSPYTKTGVEVPCAICGKMVYRKKSKLEKYSVFFCSWECEKEYQSIARSTSGLPESWRRRKYYRTWRKQVLERDSYKCKNCGSTEKLEAHHIIEAQENLDLRFEITNGITLCEKCHKEVHKNGSHNYIKSLQEAILVE